MLIPVQDKVIVCLVVRIFKVHLRVRLIGRLFSRLFNGFLEVVAVVVVGVVERYSISAEDETA
jgi:hypothetical protein